MKISTIFYNYRRLIFNIIILYIVLSCTTFIEKPISEPILTSPSSTISIVTDEIITTMNTPSITTMEPTITRTKTKLITKTNTSNPNEYVVSNYFDNWIIIRFENYDSYSITDEDAEKQIGTRITLSENIVHADMGFLWLDKCYCSNPYYYWEDDFSNHLWQALLPYDNPEKREGNPLYLSIDCNAKSYLGFEVSNLGKLVVYFDNVYFFLERDK
jgi:hypothetical protein